MTTYAVIDNDGQLHIRAGDWRAEVGPEGPARVTLHAPPDLAGWVNDCGLLFPDRYPRNVVGSVLLACLGATQRPYAGQVVITGWDPTPGQCSSEVRPLQRPDLVTTLHSQVRAALGLAAATDPDPDPEWAASARRLAERILSAPAPSLTITSLPLR